MLYLPKAEAKGMTEYALSLAGVALVVVGILMLIVPLLGSAFVRVSGGLSTLCP